MSLNNTHMLARALRNVPQETGSGEAEDPSDHDVFREMLDRASIEHTAGAGPDDENARLIKIEHQDGARTTLFTFDHRGALVDIGQLP